MSGRLWEKRLKQCFETWQKNTTGHWRYEHNEMLLFHLIAAWKKGSEQFVIIAKDLPQADWLCRELKRFVSTQIKSYPIILIPQVEGSLRRQWIPENESARCAALYDLISGRRGIYITTPQAMLAEVAPPEFFKDKIFTLKQGQQIDPDQLTADLIACDYDHESEVSMPGELSRRGGILDVYSPLYEYPIRMEFWGDEIDSLRFFSPDTQRSVQDVKEVTIIPRGESLTVLQDQQAVSIFAYFPTTASWALCDPEIIEENFKLYNSEELDKWLNLIALYPPSLIFYGEDNLTIPTNAEMFPCRLLSGDAEIADELSPWRTEALMKTLKQLQQESVQVIVCCRDTDAMVHFKTVWDDHANVCQLSVQLTSDVYLRNLYFPKQQIAFVADADLLGLQEALPMTKRHYHLRGMKESAWSEPERGELAVHASYGICRYRGVKEVEVNGELQEVLMLEFADEAILYVQPEQIALISRYVGGTKKMPKLAKIGSHAWRKACDEAGKAAWDFAAEMLRIDAMRSHQQGFSSQPNPQWEADFAASFPYQETEDQTTAIREVLADLEKEVPMDRLLCGDVGYGKTEVAIRAAFRSVLNKKQVAVLVPTTILAQQHYENFKRRMGQYPIVIEVLSRFKTALEQKKILTAVAEGKVDILIGTHRLIQNDVLFNDLGLLVIDEEQRFGVTHKQRLKELRASVDILTMTATPIPRTLYLSLSGIRHLSTLMTAPVERLPVTTITATFSKSLIREAILREVERKGQVYYLHNRVRTIEQTVEMLRKLVPEATFEFAHGQLSDDELENRMSRFVSHEFDVLVCTTIIESGLDIPNANTIIIENAERFGLSELYQLRGRVGRYHHQAYAYLLLPPSGVLPSDARQRISAMKKFTHLGAGFKLAMRDLEIRGAGNILGAQQSGHIAAVGFEMYCRLLKRAIAHLEGQAPKRHTAIPLHMDRLVMGLATSDQREIACFPKSYIGDEEVRLSVYRQLAQLESTEELNEFKLELRDRFGVLPASAELLLKCAEVQRLASRKEIIAISVREGRLAMETSRGFFKLNGHLPMLQSETAMAQLNEIIAILNR